LSPTRVSGEPLLVWPIYQVAPVVKKFDIDLVLLMTLVFAFVLTHELIRHGILPFGRTAIGGLGLPIALALLVVAGLVLVNRTLRRRGRKA
jgi:hypothetical protein